MSASHHGDDQERVNEIVKRFVQQGQRTARRAYPEGRIGPHDEGELAFTVSTDTAHGTVVVGFNKPVSWLGMGPADAVRLAEMLISHARRVSTKPLTVRIQHDGAGTDLGGN
jgi:hypothetical protein